MVDQGCFMEHYLVSTAGEALASMNQLCTLYPEPTIVVALDGQGPLQIVSAMTDEQLEGLVAGYSSSVSFETCKELLEAFRSLSLHTYCAPSVAYLPSVPRYRLLLRPSLGSARELCMIVALLHHMRGQDAVWQEMNFLSLHAGKQGISALVLKDGQIINGLGLLQGTSQALARDYLRTLEKVGPDTRVAEEAQEDLQLFQEAFWEGLSQELAGLLAVHHIEDVVVLGSESSNLVERLADTYQVYLFPHAHTEHEGYEAALGAALLGEGLGRSGKAAEVVDYLQIREARALNHVTDLL